MDDPPEPACPISIRLKVDSQPCDVALEKLQSMAKAENVPLREFSVSGRAAWEEKEPATSPVPGEVVIYVHQLGVFGRLYRLYY